MKGHHEAGDLAGVQEVWPVLNSLKWPYEWAVMCLSEEESAARHKTNCEHGDLTMLQTTKRIELLPKRWYVSMSRTQTGSNQDIYSAGIRPAVKQPRSL